MFPSYMLQGGSSSLLQGGGSGASLQGSSANPQQTISVGQLQPAGSIPVGGSGGGSGVVLGATTAVDTGAQQAAAAAAAAEAAKQAKLSQLRGDITNIANNIKDIFNSRYGMVDDAAKEQTGKLNKRFATESNDLTDQIQQENQKIGAAHAAAGSFDSSYRGNNVDTETRAGEAQIRDLGSELQDNLAKIAAWVTEQKGGFGAEKSSMDKIISRLSDSTDVNELTNLRNTLDGKIAELKGGQAAYNTNAQNMNALRDIAPANARVQQLQTTLSQIVAGSADPSQKQAIGQRLIQSAGLNPDDEQNLLNSFNGDLLKKEQTTA